MTDRQNQRVDECATAIQAGGDVTLYHGISPNQMSEIMVAMARQMSTYHAEARIEAERRFASFRDEVLEQFAKPEKANPEAFRDPDFQYLLNDAQRAYARSGEDEVRETLVDLIARRSLEPTRTRLAINLSEAATRVANLTAEEFATLSLCFVVRYTRDHRVRSIDGLASHIRSRILPFVAKIQQPVPDSSFQHLQAQSCGSLEITELDVVASFKANYAGLFSDGFTKQQLAEWWHPGSIAFDRILIPCLNDSSKLQFSTIDRDTFIQRAGLRGVSKPEAERVWGHYEETMRSPREIIVQAVPEAEPFFELWKNSALKRFSLTTIGIAIAHANATRAVGFDAPLSFWIK